MTRDTSLKQSNFLVRLFRGEVPLVITYWVFGVAIGGLAMGLGIELMLTQILQLAATEHGPMWISAMYWSFVAYAVFISIAVWRSASNYKGRFLYACLAKTAVVLNFMSLATGVFMAQDSDTALAKEAEIVNRGLPIMIDHDTRLDRLTIDKGNMHYHYTMVHWLKEDLDIDHFVSAMTAHQVPYYCDDDHLRGMLNQGRDIISSFQDKQNKHFSRIVVSVADCGEA